MILLAVVALLVLAVITAFLFAIGELEGGGETASSQDLYEKKPFVFDKLNELTLYRTLVDLFGDRYYVFPQVVYSRLVKTKPGVHLRHRTNFDKKTADFVLCDKERAIARLVIELDGASHLSYKRQQRDSKIDTLMADIGLPILHLPAANLSREHVEAEVRKFLS